MTGRIASAATAKVLARIMGPSGLNNRLAALRQGAPADALEATQVQSQNVAAELAERSATVRYPFVNIYCEKLVNNLAEKFRTFSGTAQMTIELRQSQDRLDGLQDSLELYTDAILGTLDSSRGDWGDGMYYAGGYQVSIGSVKHGGRNFIQAAKVTFEIGVNRS